MGGTTESGCVFIETTSVETLGCSETDTDDSAAD